VKVVGVCMQDENKFQREYLKLSLPARVKEVCEAQPLSCVRKVALQPEKKKDGSTDKRD